MYIVIGGGGKVAESLAQRLLNSGHEVAVIEESKSRADRLATVLKGRVMVVCGNCCNAGSLTEAGIEHADLICAVTGQDDNNLATCEIAKALFKIPRTIARVNNPKNERIFQSLGISAVSSTTVIAQMVEEEATASTLKTIMSLKHGAFTIMEIEIPHSHSLETQGGCRVCDLELPPSTILIAVSHGEQFDTVNGQTTLMPGDTVLVCSKTDVADDARRVLLDL